MFVFYFGLFANITPPVALAAFAGAGIAGGDPMKTGFQSLKLSLAGFIVPFLFVYNPAMLMIDTTNVATTARDFALPPIMTIIMVSITSIVGIIALSASIEGYYKTKIPMLLRLVLAVGALMMIVPEVYTDMGGATLVIAMIALNTWQAKKMASTATEQLSS
jgi:TRAP-type uncharacterized transport system fused permease subunit